MPTISVQEAQKNLADVVHNLAPGTDVIITENDRPIARLVALAPPKAPSPMLGRCAGMLTVIAEDDEHFKTFHEYGL